MDGKIYAPSLDGARRVGECEWGGERGGKV